MYFGTTPSVLPHVRTARLRGLAVTSLKRSHAAPDLPTLHEAALPGFDNSAWHCLLAPANTPPVVINRLHTETVRVLRLPETVERMASQGVDVIAGTPAELAAYIRQDLVKFEKLIKSAGIKIE
jgi:tripartite-type tricarboxylate transporter receptor subunit TctC